MNVSKRVEREVVVAFGLGVPKLGYGLRSVESVRSLRQETLYTYTLVDSIISYFYLLNHVDVCILAGSRVYYVLAAHFWDCILHPCLILHNGNNPSKDDTPYGILMTIFKFAVFVRAPQCPAGRM